MHVSKLILLEANTIFLIIKKIQGLPYQNKTDNLRWLSRKTIIG